MEILKPEQCPAVLCDYCNQPAEIVKLERRWIWRCVPCDARIGVNPTSPSMRPEGRLANRDLRRAKRLARAAFDILWQAALERRRLEGKSVKSVRARARAYQWLSAELGIAPRDCHFSLFDVDQCQRVVEICDANVPPFMRGEE